MLIFINVLQCLQQSLVSFSIRMVCSMSHHKVTLPPVTTFISPLVFQTADSARSSYISIMLKNFVGKRNLWVYVGVNFRKQYSGYTFSVGVSS